MVERAFATSLGVVTDGLTKKVPHVLGIDCLNVFPQVIVLAAKGIHLSTGLLKKGSNPIFSSAIYISLLLI